MKNTQPVHAWPNAAFDIRVNNNPISLRKALKKLPDQVADLTPSTKQGSNFLQVCSQAYMPFIIVVNVMKKLSVEDLSSVVLQARTLEYEKTLLEVKNSFNKKGEDEIQEMSTKISLRCPLTRAPIVNPSRANTCKHFQCFELNNYLAMNERIPTWKCPICSQTAHYSHLVIDNYMKQILTGISSQVEDIVIQPDGTWSVPSNKRKPERKVEAPQPKIPIESIELLDEEEEISKKVLRRSTSLDNMEKDVDNFFSFFPEESDIKEEKTVDRNSCFVCGQTEGTRRCSACTKISYCGRDCQTKDWERHKLECRSSSSTPPPKKKTKNLI
jgi:hypothetical protein